MQTRPVPPLAGPPAALRLRGTAGLDAGLPRRAGNRLQAANAGDKVAGVCLHLAVDFAFPPR